MTRCGLVLALVLLVAWSASAQTICPAPVAGVVPALPPTAAFCFAQDDLSGNSVLPATDVNAGQPVVTSFQGFLYAATAAALAQPSNATPLATGSIVPKGLAMATGVAASPWSLTLAQLGLTIPSCAVAPCPQYFINLTAIGPNGVDDPVVAGALSESVPFTAPVPAVALTRRKPAPPVRVVAQP